MPELPEVQTTANSLNHLTRGLKIHDVWTNYRSSFHKGKNNIKDSDYFIVFKKAVLGKKIIKINRRAKNVLIHLSSDTTILVHMKMTGHLLYGTYKKVRGLKGTSIKEGWIPKEKGPLNDPFNRFIRLVFSLSNGKHLVLSDMRKFAKVLFFTTSKTNELADLKNLGPEPLDKKFTFQSFKKRLFLKPNGKIKQVLMDQSVISGVGNIYSDEALWLSAIHPATQIKKLKNEKINSLYKNSILVLKKGIRLGGDSMSDYRTPSGIKGRFQLYHQAYGRKKEKCQKFRCGGIIDRIKVGGRSAHFCPKHQKLIP